jgi:hypothetical protein
MMRILYLCGFDYREMSQFINDEVVSHDINHKLDRQNIRKGLCATPAIFQEGENTREILQPRRGAMNGPR